MVFAAVFVGCHARVLLEIATEEGGVIAAVSGVAYLPAQQMVVVVEGLLFFVGKGLDPLGDGVQHEVPNAITRGDVFRRVL